METRWRPNRWGRWDVRGGICEGGICEGGICEGGNMWGGKYVKREYVWVAESKKDITGDTIEVKKNWSKGMEWGGRGWEEIKRERRVQQSGQWVVGNRGTEGTKIKR